MDNVILNVSDWNYQDKWFQMPLALLVELQGKVKSAGINSAWGWLVKLVDYTEDRSDASKPVWRCDHAVDHTLDEYFLDWTNPLESVDEWEFDED